MMRAREHRRIAGSCQFVLVGWLLVSIGLRESAAAETRPVAGAAVELPPMLVEESVASAPWLYVQVGGTEFLSRCSEGTTREFIQAWLERIQLIPAVVPPEFMARMDVPAVCVLYAQDLRQTVSAEIQRQLQGGDGAPDAASRVNIAPNMRLMDRDVHATIVYIDEAQFEGATLSIAPSHIRYLLQGRLPQLPAWLVEGIERLWHGADFVLDPITLRPLVWLNAGESDALASDPTRPRAVVPASELFAGEADRSHRHSRYLEALASSQELFVRWALLSGPRSREALWRFAAGAAEAPVTETAFEAAFGLDFSELRDQLSDYLPKAVQQPARIAPGRHPPLPTFRVERATPNQIARLRGEWERLAISHVQRTLPAAREPDVAQARRTLRRAYDGGDRDPRLLATIGLCELDAGDEAAARTFLEQAVALGVVRPRACFELARLRYAALRRSTGDRQNLSFTELAPVLEPLRHGLAQAPALPEAYLLLAETWSRCELSPNAAEIADLEAGARLFPRRPPVACAIATALARHGKKAKATGILDACATVPTDEVTQAAIAQLRMTLATGATRTADQ